MDPLWQGDTRPAPREILRAFSDSTADDGALLRYDILGSLAHTFTLQEAGLLTGVEAVEIRAGLRALLAAPPRLEAALEDVHMNVEAALTRLTASGAKLHAARSRNDQVALDLRLFARARLLDLADALLAHASALLAAAERHAADPMPGRTHLQPGQPVTLGHHLHAHAERTLRDLVRADAAFRAANVSPLGAGALAGTTLGTDPAVAARLLAFDRPFANSLDAVSDRDFALDALHAASVALLHLSGFGEELVLWSTPEFGYVALADDLTTGSSLMPQKRNPDGAELLRSASAVALAESVAVAGVLRSLPLAYNRDLQDAKAPLLRALPRAVLATRLATALLDGARFDVARIAAGLTRGHPEATDVADALVRAGVPFREAHHRAARLVAEADRLGVALADLPDGTLRAAGLPNGAPRADPALRTSPGGPAPKRVLAAVAASRQALSSLSTEWAARRARVAEAETALEGSP